MWDIQFSMGDTVGQISTVENYATYKLKVYWFEAVNAKQDIKFLVTKQTFFLNPVELILMAYNWVLCHDFVI